MKSFDNIETRKFPGRDHYTGYSADGRSWRIMGGSGNWSAHANVTSQEKLSMLMGFERMQEISDELRKIT